MTSKPPTGNQLDETMRVASVPRRSRPHSRGEGDAHFIPGTLVADRYRISGLLGAGGMGEVYRADDLKLGQTVALKFLPQSLEGDESLLDMLHEEVRLGRQVAHPNVCRIYDIVESDGAHFVSMEFVDGENLAVLLQRIGRLAADKAVEIARSLAAGLAAAHAKGILHRDLKPANVMIDGQGEPRITDFGLALASEDSVDSGLLAGTPAYMAPEQLEGKAPSVQSDLYAFGLILYEMVTGKRLRSAGSLAELSREPDQVITRPSSIVREVEPALEAIILRCLERDPALRPRSARQVFEALPGGDPLNAAMAAGKTPSPAMVAAAGEEGALTPAAAWLWVAAIVLMYAATVMLGRSLAILAFVPMPQPTAVLEARAVEIGEQLGIPAQRYRVSRWGADRKYVVWLAAHDRSATRWERLRGEAPSVTLRVRQSPTPLVALSGQPLITADDPPLSTPGMSTIEVDTKGRLVAVSAPPARAGRRHADWQRITTLMGLDFGSLRPVASTSLPPFFAEERGSWEGTRLDRAHTPVRVDIAATDGVPVYARAGGPWDAVKAAERSLTFNDVGMSRFLLGVGIAVLSVAILLAWFNLRKGRGDQVAATRLTLVAFLASLAVFLLLATHTTVFSREAALWSNAFADSISFAAILGVAYLGIEPFLRRRSPHCLISWARLLHGNVRDPMVGRDVLIGIAAGLAHSLIANATGTIPAMVGFEVPPPPHMHTLDGLTGVAAAVGMGIAAIPGALRTALVLMAVLVVFHLVFRNRGMALTALFLVQSAGLILAVRAHPSSILFVVPIAALYTVVIGRWGLLAVAALQATFDLAFALPQPMQGEQWMLPMTLVPPILLGLLTLYAFRTAIGTRRAFSTAFLDE